MLTDQVKITDKYGKTRYTRPPDRSTLKKWLDDKIVTSNENFLYLYKDCINLKKDENGNVDDTWKTNMEKNYKELEDKEKELNDVKKAITDFSENQKKLEEKTKELEEQKTKVIKHKEEIDNTKNSLTELEKNKITNETLFDLEEAQKELDKFNKEKVNLEEQFRLFVGDDDEKEKLVEKITKNTSNIKKKKNEIDTHNETLKSDKNYTALQETKIKLEKLEKDLKSLEEKTEQIQKEVDGMPKADQKTLEKKQKDVSKELLDLQVKHGKDLQGHVKPLVEGDIMLYSKNMTEAEIKKEQKLQRMRLQKLNWLFGKEAEDEGRLQLLHTKKEKFDEKVKKWEELNVLDADSEEAKKALKDLEDYTRKEIRTEPINLNNAIWDLSVKHKWDIIGPDVFGMAGNKLFSFDKEKGTLAIDRNTEEGREAALAVLMALKKSNTPYIKLQQGDEVGIELALLAGFSKDQIIEIRNPQDYKRERAERMLSQDFYGIDDIWKERTLTERERQGESISTSGGGETLQQRRERELREGSQNQPKNINLKQN